MIIEIATWEAEGKCRLLIVKGKCSFQNTEGIETPNTFLAQNFTESVNSRKTVNGTFKKKSGE